MSSPESLERQLQAYRIFLDPCLPFDTLVLASRLGIVSAAFEEADLCITEPNFSTTGHHPKAVFVSSKWLQACVDQQTTDPGVGPTIGSNEEEDDVQLRPAVDSYPNEQQRSASSPSSSPYKSTGVRCRPKNPRKPPRWTFSEKEDLIAVLAGEKQSLTAACKTFLEDPKRAGRSVKSVLVHIRSSKDFYQTELAKLGLILPRARDGGHWSHAERSDLIRAVAASSTLEEGFELFHESNGERTVLAIATQWKLGLLPKQYEQLVLALRANPDLDLETIDYDVVSRYTIAPTSSKATISSSRQAPSSSTSTSSPFSTHPSSLASSLPLRPQRSTRQSKPAKVKSKTFRQRVREDEKAYFDAQPQSRTRSKSACVSSERDEEGGSLRVGRMTRSGSYYVGTSEDDEFELAIKQSLEEGVMGKVAEEDGDFENQAETDDAEAEAIDADLFRKGWMDSKEVMHELESVQDQLPIANDTETIFRPTSLDLDFPVQTISSSRRASPVPTLDSIIPSALPASEHHHLQSYSPSRSSWSPASTDDSSSRSHLEPYSSQQGVHLPSQPDSSTQLSFTYEPSDQSASRSQSVLPSTSPRSLFNRHQAAFEYLASFNFPSHPSQAHDGLGSDSFYQHAQPFRPFRPTVPLPSVSQSEICHFCSTPTTTPHRILTASHELTHVNSSTLSLVKAYRVACDACECRFNSKKFEMQRRGSGQEEQMVIATLAVKRVAGRVTQ